MEPVIVQSIYPVLWKTLVHVQSIKGEDRGEILQSQDTRCTILISIGQRICGGRGTLGECEASSETAVTGIGSRHAFYGVSGCDCILRLSVGRQDIGAGGRAYGADDGRNERLGVCAGDEESSSALRSGEACEGKSDRKGVHDGDGVA
jgi:hypothetical protein